MNITKEILEYNTKHNLFIENRDESAKWFTYAQYYCHKHGMTDEIYINATSYFASIFLGGMGLSAGAEEFFQQKMEYDLVDYIGGFDFHNFSDDDKKKVFMKIFEWMETRAVEYEKMYSQHNAALPLEAIELLKRVKGNTYREKILNLMLDPQDTKFTKTTGKKEIRWNFKYTESKLWDKLEGENDRVKLMNLL